MTAGTFEQKSKVCRDCTICKGKAPLPPDSPKFISESDDPEVQDLVDEIARLISLDNCNVEIDWARKDFAYFNLFQIWRASEREIKNLRDFKTQKFMERAEKFIVNFRLF